jgi:hypothetical protein
MDLSKYQRWKEHGLVMLSKTPLDPNAVLMQVARFDPDTGDRINGLLIPITAAQIQKARQDLQVQLASINLLIQDAAAVMNGLEDR